MSVGRMIWLMCDMPGCDEEWEEIGTATESALRRNARTGGWHVGRSRSDADYCPLHRSFRLASND